MRTKTPRPPLIVQRSADSHITLDRETRTEYSAFHADAGLLGIVGSVMEAETLIREYRAQQQRVRNALDVHADRIARLRAAVAAAEAVLGA